MHHAVTVHRGRDGMAKYSKIAILFHWLIAILIGANIFCPAPRALPI
jgi:cytochrome b561